MPRENNFQGKIECHGIYAWIQRGLRTTVQPRGFSGGMRKDHICRKTALCTVNKAFQRKHAGMYQTVKD